MLDDNMPYRRILEPEPYPRVPYQHHVPRVKESQMNEAKTDQPAQIENQILTEPIEVAYTGGSTQIHLPTQLAIERINLRSDMAKTWVDAFKLEEVGDHGPYFLESELELLSNPKFKIIRDALNFYFLPVKQEVLDEICFIMTGDEPFHVPEESRILLEDVKSVISLFPDLESRLGFSENRDGLLKLPEVARMLSVSESKVRKLASDGSIKHTKSQGETGHYRFTRAAIREYVESRKVG